MKKMIVMAVMALAMLFGFTAPAMAQNSKLSPATRIIIADRDGRASIKKAKTFPKGHLSAKKQKVSVKGMSTTENTGSTSEIEGTAPFAEPVTIDGVKMAQCWIKMTDNNYSAIEALGVKIQAKYDCLVVANIPIDVLEQVAALSNVKKVAVASMMQKFTYDARQKTNVDDVLNLTEDAQAAGLLQAYDGTDVVIGIIDTDIQFNHKMFKDENGHTRIKKAIVYNATSEQLEEYDTQSAIEALTYDAKDDFHGTHTSSIAGGTNYSFTGYYYDNSTGNFAQGTRIYGGMAPKADLVLCGLGEMLTQTNIAICIQKIGEYASSVNKPCIISISLGNQAGPHDGTGYMSEAYKSFVESGDGRIIVKAAGNDGGRDVYLYKNATKASPAMSVLNNPLNKTLSYEENNDTYNYNDCIINDWVYTYARTPNVEMAARLYVVDTSNNTIVWMSDEVTNDKIWSVNEGDDTYNSVLAQYFEALNANSYLSVQFDIDEETGKQYIYTNASYLITTNNTEQREQTGGNWYSGYTYTYTYTGHHKIAVSFYPKNDGVTLDIDSWGQNYTYFESGSYTYNNSSYTFVAGNSTCSVDDNSTSPYVIPIGSYTSLKGWAAPDGSGYTLYDEVDDIASSSSYQAPGAGPLGNKLPWITAPGQALIAGGNSAWAVDNPEDDYLLDQYDASNPLAIGTGTSMASPCAGGIVALWLQVDPNLSYLDVKELMQETAIHDDYTDGTKASRFGQGKIDALAGIEYLLKKMVVEPTALEFECEKQPETAPTQTFYVKASKAVTATLEGDDAFSIDINSISQAEARSGKDITVSFNPQEAGEYNATVTLTCDNQTPVVVTLHGVATDFIEVTVSEYGLTTLYYDQPLLIPYDTYPIDLLGVYYAREATGKELKMKFINETIPANEGVVVQANSGTYRFPITTPDKVTALSPANILTGTLETVSAASVKDSNPGKVVMTLGRGSNGYIGFYKYTGKTLNAHKAYLLYDSGSNSNVNALSMGGVGGDEFTSIQDVNVQENDGVWYTLQGVRLNGTPKQLGIYIRNGKTVVVK